MNTGELQRLTPELDQRYPLGDVLRDSLEKRLATRGQALITVTTAQSGPVLRWHTSIHAVTIGVWMLEAGWQGVRLPPGVYLTDIPDGWDAEARRAHALLKSHEPHLIGQALAMVNCRPGEVPAPRGPEAA